MNLVPSLLPSLNTFYQNHFGNTQPASSTRAMHVSERPTDPADDSELDAEGEEVDDDYEIPYHQGSATPEKRILTAPSDTSHSGSANSGAASNANSDSEDNEWGGESELEEDVFSQSPERTEIDELNDSSVDSEPRSRIPRRSLAATNRIDVQHNHSSRPLRKRKSSDPDHLQRPIRLRRRASDGISTTAGADRSISMNSDEETTNSQRPQRLRRSKKLDRSLVTVTPQQGASLVVTFYLDQLQMKSILLSKPRKNRNRERAKRRNILDTFVEEEAPHYPPISTSLAATFLPALEKDADAEKNKPYGGILSESDADTSNTFPLGQARQKFEDARVRAEEDWKKKMNATNNLPEPTKPHQKMSGPPSKIKCINFGGYEIDTWNAAPYPEEYSRNKILYICEFCLKYMNSDFVAWRHKLKCGSMHPPGDEIYRDGRFSFFEVDGRKNPVYCQNLCLLAKLFLGSKTLYIDVEPFLFYVMTENDELGCHFVGYFSKEKRSSSMNNVSCILVMPICQRRGFGHMLIEFSYLLTKVEKKTGSPEKPLSDMGLVSYRGYWRLIMCYELIRQKDAISINEITRRTGMTADDVISALEGLRAIVRDPVSKNYALRLDRDYYQEYITNYEKKNYPRINSDALVWVPYVNRGLTNQYEGAYISTVAQREDEDKMDVDLPPKLTDKDVEMSETVPIETHLESHSNESNHDDEDEDDDDDDNTNNDNHDVVVVNGTAAPSTPNGNGNGNGNGNTSHTSKVEKLNATNYEVFPPGSSTRRKGRSNSRLTRTPHRNRDHTAAGATVTSNGSPVLRRTRSSNTETSLINGLGHDSEEDAEGEDE